MLHVNDMIFRSQSMIPSIIPSFSKEAFIVSRSITQKIGNDFVIVDILTLKTESPETYGYRGSQSPYIMLLAGYLFPLSRCGFYFYSGRDVSISIGQQKTCSMGAIMPG